jgi:hypothetical protein
MATIKYISAMPFRYALIFASAAILLLSAGCERDDNVLVAIVRFETFTPAQTVQGAETGGRVLANRDIDFEEYGVCYSTRPNPGIGDLIASGTNLETSWVQESYSIEFTATITGLTAGTKYYLRAFLTTRTGTAYGAEVEFTPN